MAQQVVISFNANANFSDLIGEVRRANAEIGTLQSQLNGLGTASYGSLNSLNKQFIEGMRNTRLWSSTFVDVANETREFGRHLDQGRLKLKDYFREFSTQVQGQRGMIRRLAEEQVRLQRSILTTAVGPQGEQKNILSTPTGLDRLDPATMKALRAEQFKIIGKSIQGVSTELINLGKNTQWAGRQLTVGLTVPLTIFASSAATAFKEVDQQLTRLAKVYGDIGGATKGEIAAIKKETSSLAKELASSMGAAATDTIALAADIAATGKTGNDLLQSVTETTRLSVLGEVDRQQAMAATLSLQSAFNLNTKQLSESINFLNAVENQTSTSLQDLTDAIPKAGPVVRQLGGDVKDLALFLTAMKEGGINAAEAANALKSGLASIINPTQKTREVMNGFGIDIQNIVNNNAGNLVGTVTALKDALNTLNPLARAQAIEQIFGKFQFARMSALFDNLGKSGSQTVQVIKLMGASTADLAAIADRELTTLTESASGKFQRQMESLKANMALAGEGFLGIFSKVLGGINKILEGFNKLPDGAKTVLTIVGAVVGLAGPFIMLSGVFLNFIGYVVKSVGALGRLFTQTGKFELLDEKMMALKLAGDKTASMFYDQADAAKAAQLQIDKLIASLQSLTEAQRTDLSGSAMQSSAYKFTAAPGAQAGDINKSRAEQSHLVPESTLNSLYGKQVASTMFTQGAYVPGSREFSEARGFQQSMQTDMPGYITNGEDRRALLAEAARKRGLQDTVAKELTQQELKALMPDVNEFIKKQAGQLAAWKTFENMSEKEAQAMRKVLFDAMKSGDSQKALEAIRYAAAAQGLNFDEMSVEYGKIAKVAYDSGTDVKTRSAALLAKLGELESGIIASDKKIKDWAGLSGKKASKLAQNIGELSALALTNVTTTFTDMNISSGINESELVQTINTATKSLGVATVKIVDGVVQVITESGKVLKEEDVKNQKVKTAIQQLKAKKIQLEAEKVKEVEEIIAIENAGIIALQSDNALLPAETSKIGIVARAKNGVKGMMTGKGGLGSSMAMMGLGMATTMLPTGNAGNVVGGAMMGASMGMMFGPEGAAVGAALGALVPAIKLTIEYFGKLADIQALSIKQYQIDKEYAKAAGLNLKTIGDIQLTQIVGKSEQAASALEVLAKAALDASTATSTGALREKTKGAKTFQDVRGEFESQYLSYIAAGASEETAKQMMAAILKAAGKEGFSTDLKMALSALGAQNQTTSTQALVSKTGGVTLAGTDYAKLAAANPVMENVFANIKAGTAGYDRVDWSANQEKTLAELEAAYQKLTVAQQNFINSGKDVTKQVEVLNNALANQDSATFAENMKLAGESGNLAQEAVDKVVNSISGLAPVERTVFEGLKRNGVDSAAQMLALKMRIEGIIPSLQAVKDFDGNHIRMYFELYQANQAMDKAKGDLKTAIESMYAGGGSGVSSDAQKKALQAQLDALDEIERKEKNINKLKDLSIKYEEKRRALAADYLSALSNGDMEGALRAQIEMEKESVAYAREKAQTEKDISRENQKKALQDKIKGLDSASGTIGKVANKAKEVETNINDAISSVVAGFSKNGKMTVSFDEFTKSEAFTTFESKWKNTLSGDAMTKAMEALKASFKQMEAQLAELSAGTTIGVGTSSKPRDITAYAQSQGVARAAGKDGVSTALSDEQRTAILADNDISQQILDKEYVIIFGEKYQYKNGELIRHKNSEGKWSGGLIKGPGSGVSDSIVAKFAQGGAIRVSNGEFVQSARAVNYYGVANMEKLNNRLVSPSVFDRQDNKTSGSGDVNVTIGNINITEPGCTPDEIIAKIKKDLGAAVKRTTDMRYMSV